MDMNNGVGIPEGDWVEGENGVNIGTTVIA